MQKLLSAILCISGLLLPLMNAAAAEKDLVIIGASYVQEWGTPELPGYRVVNKGVGGEESTSVRARFERDAIALAPDAVIIWGHYNDMVRASDDKIAAAQERARENYRWMTQRAREAGIEVILATEITIPIADSLKEKLMAFLGDLRGKQDYRVKKNQAIKTVNEWLRDYAKSQNIRLLDLEKALDSGNGTRKVEYTREDNSHVSPEGYAAITRYTVATLGL